MNYWPVLLVALAALLWGTDSIIRYPAVHGLDSKVLVLFEHIVGLALITPWFFYKHLGEFKKIRPIDLVGILVLGIGGSALGGILYTESIRYIGPSSATLFQMIQPLFVIGIAAVILKEKESAQFFQCAVWVLLNAVLISFPDFNFGFSVASREQLQWGFIYGFCAMTVWGLATVMGKWLLFRFSPAFVVFTRWLTAVVFISALISMRGTPIDWSALTSSEILIPLILMGTVAGSFSMVIYYSGLSRLPASLVTFIELLYPLAGVLLPASAAGVSLSIVQLIGIIGLVASISLLVNLERQSLAKIS